MHDLIFIVLINVLLIRSESSYEVKIVGSDYDYLVDCNECGLNLHSSASDFCFQREEEFRNRVILSNGTEHERTFQVKVYSHPIFEGHSETCKCSPNCKYSIVTYDYGTVFSFTKNEINNVTIKWIPNEDINMNIYEGNTDKVKCIDTLAEQLDASISYETSIKGIRIENGTLILPTLIEADSGVIDCSARFDSDQSISTVRRIINLSVLKPLVIKSLTKTIERKAGLTVTMQCLIESYSPVQVHWYKDGYKLFSGHKYTTNLYEVGESNVNEYKTNVVGVTTGKTISLAEVIVHDIENSDTGTYICQAENNIVVKTEEINLIVTRPLIVHW